MGMEPDAWGGGVGVPREISEALIQAFLGLEVARRQSARAAATESGRSHEVVQTLEVAPSRAGGVLR